MSTNFTFPEKRYLRIAACILLMFSTGCRPQAVDTGSDMHFSADTAGNSHLKHICFARNKDSVWKYAEADYKKQKYYIFWTGRPGEARFNSYLAAYAKKRYNIILIDCGFKNRLGAYYYNSRMAAFLKTNKKPVSAIYLEAKDRYNKTPAVYANAGHLNFINVAI